MAERRASLESNSLLALLRQVRREAGLRQVDVARKLGQPQPFVSKYESGERRLDILELRALCQALGISTSEFCDRLEALIDEA
jgi:transcriptional regulator with XRE-family HTH domain